MRNATLIAVTLLALTALAAVPTTVQAFGADHPPKQPVNNPKWPAGLAELVNADNRVHGFFVNFGDVFFLRGDTRALNAFLDAYARLPGDIELRVVLHPGKLPVQSPWDKKPHDTQADWKLYATSLTRQQVEAMQKGDAKPRRFTTRVDIYLGGSVTLDELKIPANVPVESGGEIEAFVKRSRDRK